MGWSSPLCGSGRAPLSLLGMKSALLLGPPAGGPLVCGVNSPSDHSENSLSIRRLGVQRLVTAVEQWTGACACTGGISLPLSRRALRISADNLCVASARWFNCTCPYSTYSSLCKISQFTRVSLFNAAWISTRSALFALPFSFIRPMTNSSTSSSFPSSESSNLKSIQASDVSMSMEAKTACTASSFIRASNSSMVTMPEPSSSISSNKRWILLT
mmetsp:Transcript_24217/g.44259  ORF Transcript_24217/g.44259 Transcript_24217/m.44259 type:complete len:215 (+) Transcript_24217:136-780(+)